jgi:hypothetical protein
MLLTGLENRLPNNMTVLLTLNLLILYIYIYIYIYVCVAPCKTRDFNVVYTFIYEPTFGNAESRLFLFASQCFNTEPMQKCFLCHSCV